MRTWRPTAAAAWVLVACIVLGGLLAVCVVFGPAWLVGPQSGLTAAGRLSAENAARATLLQGLVGLLALGGVAVGAVVTFDQVKASREVRSIDLFTKAIDLLASDQVSVRHGGVYALEQLSGLDDDYRGHAHALLTSFVCQHAPWPPSTPGSEVQADRARPHGGLADDVAAAMAALGRRKMIVDDAPSELERVDLRGAELDKLNLPNACFAHANLDDASLAKANLANATLSETTLRNTDLAEANLREANLTGAFLDGAILRGADLSKAKLQDAHLAGVISDRTTKWPHGFIPPQPGE
jgi:Pentapeptide repeats (8 copies)